MKDKKIYIIIVVFVIIIVATLIILNEAKKDTVRLYFLPLKDADASIIQYKDKIIIIDTGEKKDEQEIRKALKKFKIRKIDYLILTHPDKDHIGNAKYIIENYQVDKIFQTDYNKNSSLQEQLNKIIVEKNVESQILKEKQILEIDNLKITIYPPEKQYEDSNNNSLITLLEFDGKKALYVGDIEEERMEDILDKMPRVNLLKYPHHGKENKLAEEFIKKTSPEITVITGETPNEDIIRNLEQINSKIRLTCQQPVDITFK